MSYCGYKDIISNKLIEIAGIDFFSDMASIGLLNDECANLVLTTLLGYACKASNYYPISIARSLINKIPKPLLEKNFTLLL
ncbi:MAG: hypothetical protein LBS74_06165 [Oscillospiraceae bacterium]|nr:hypothetical protein [Oscillospiraceae bacterium]